MVLNLKSTKKWKAILIAKIKVHLMCCFRSAVLHDENVNIHMLVLRMTYFF